MVPKKPSEIVKLVSEQLDVSERLVDKLIDSYYKELRIKMSNLEDTRYYVPGLGIFSARLNKVQEAIRKRENISKVLKDKTMQQYQSKKEYLLNIERLKKIEQKLIEELETFNNCKNGKINNSLEK